MARVRSRRRRESKRDDDGANGESVEYVAGDDIYRRCRASLAVVAAHKPARHIAFTCSPVPCVSSFPRPAPRPASPSIHGLPFRRSICVVVLVVGEASSTVSERLGRVGVEERRAPVVVESQPIFGGRSRGFPPARSAWSFSTVNYVRALLSGLTFEVSGSSSEA